MLFMDWTARHSFAGFCVLSTSRTAFKVPGRAGASSKALTIEGSISKFLWLLGGFRFWGLLKEASQFPTGCRPCSVPDYRGLSSYVACFSRASKGVSVLVGALWNVGMKGTFHQFCRPAPIPGDDDYIWTWIPGQWRSLRII